jgi:hypothetical protein
MVREYKNMSYLTQSFLMVLAMSLTLADQAFLDPGQPRQEVTPIQLEEVTDKILFKIKGHALFKDETPTIGLDGSFACGISTGYEQHVYDNTSGYYICKFVRHSKLGSKDN